MDEDELIALYLNRQVIREWTRRDMGSMVPEFKSVTEEFPVVRITREVCEKIAEDCATQFVARGVSQRARVGYSTLYSFCKEALAKFDMQDKLVARREKQASDAIHST